MSNIKTNLPNITFMFREGDEATEDGGCAIGGEFVAKLLQTCLLANDH